MVSVVPSLYAPLLDAVDTPATFGFGVVQVGDRQERDARRSAPQPIEVAADLLLADQFQARVQRCG